MSAGSPHDTRELETIRETLFTGGYDGTEGQEGSSDTTWTDFGVALGIAERVVGKLDTAHSENEALRNEVANLERRSGKPGMAGSGRDEIDLAQALSSDEIAALLVERDALVGELDTLRAAHERGEERIRELALLFDVPDGGRYLNDWKSRADAVVSLREALREIVAQDAVELALDPQWSQRIAEAALAAGSRVEDA